LNGKQGNGVVLASYGRGVLVQAGEATLYCALKGRKQRIVCGDRVNWTRTSSEDGATVESIEPRRNLIERIDARGRAEPVAADIDCIGIVAAPKPEPDWFVIDRYWAAARLKDVAAILMVNKSDLGLDSLESELAVYRGLGLPCFELSILSGRGLAQLPLNGNTLLVGQSGVGKSSLVNALVPDAAAQTAALTREVEGRHTTTTARRYRLEYHMDSGREAPGAAVIDAPGVRDFAPPATLMRAAELGFVEIHHAAADCRFNDCRHREEPGCAVRAAVLAQRISARRYESYRRLLRLYEKLAP
jgi:ribosome biogenesis GTPase / thiamine phosphate phosphatase